MLQCIWVVYPFNLYPDNYFSYRNLGLKFLGYSYGMLEKIDPPLIVVKYQLDK